MCNILSRMQVNKEKKNDNNVPSLSLVSCPKNVSNSVPVVVVSVVSVDFVVGSTAVPLFWLSLIIVSWLKCAEHTWAIADIVRIKWKYVNGIITNLRRVNREEFILKK